MKKEGSLHRINRPNAAEIQERRRVLHESVALLSASASYEKFVATYARMNPAAQIKANAFYFREPNTPPRAIIYGTWLYVHAPGVKLPAGVLQVSADERKRHHLGALHARIPLRVEGDLAILRMVIRAVRSAGKARG